MWSGVLSVWRVRAGLRGARAGAGRVRSRGTSGGGGAREPPTPRALRAQGISGAPRGRRREEQAGGEKTAASVSSEIGSREGLVKRARKAASCSSRPRRAAILRHAVDPMGCEASTLQRKRGCPVF